jgi:hypothetical protein
VHDDAQIMLLVNEGNKIKNGSCAFVTLMMKQIEEREELFN